VGPIKARQNRSVGGHQILRIARKLQKARELIMQRLLFAAGGLSAVLVSSISSVSAQEQFVGRWAVKPEICASHGGDTPENSALVATDSSLWWFDGYCRIGKMYKAKAVYVQAHCLGKGDVPVTLDAQGDRMKITWDRTKVENLKRCR
jgi:hypothetical protein